MVRPIHDEFRFSSRTDWSNSYAAFSIFATAIAAQPRSARVPPPRASASTWPFSASPRARLLRLVDSAPTGCGHRVFRSNCPSIATRAASRDPLASLRSNWMTMYTPLSSCAAEDDNAYCFMRGIEVSRSTTSRAEITGCPSDWRMSSRIDNKRARNSTCTIAVMVLRSAGLRNNLAPRLGATLAPSRRNAKFWQKPLSQDYVGDKKCYSPNPIEHVPISLSADSKFTQKRHHRAPVGKSRLKQVQADKSREQVPVRV